MPEEGITAPPDVPRIERPELPPAIGVRARRLAWLYLAVSVGMLPWIAYLALTLPGRNIDVHYRLAWVGFDCLLVLALAGTAYLAFRVDPRVEITATVTATMLVVDAWFDVTTSGRGESLILAIALAVCAELPAAVFSLYVARRVNRRVVELAHLDRSRSDGAPGARSGAHRSQSSGAPTV